MIELSDGPIIIDDSKNLTVYTDIRYLTNWVVRGTNILVGSESLGRPRSE